MSASETAGGERMATSTALPAAKVSRTQLLLALGVTLLGLGAFTTP